VRSWRLTRGRFWVAFGVTFLIGAIMGLAMQVVSFPVALLSSLLGSVVAPTGASEPSAVIGFVLALLAPQVLLLVLQAITLVVQSTGSALVYLDCRMRYEGLDQTLIAHVERRQLGWTEEQLDDPFAVDPTRAVSSAPPPRQHPAPPSPPGYPAQPYTGRPQPVYVTPQPVGAHPSAFSAPPPPPPAPPASPASPADGSWSPPADGGWAAPGGGDSTA
jgi:hypothetical protein